MEKNFGEFLKQKRQDKNLTQKDLAKSLFVSESAVSKWEKNIAHPDITLLPKLAELLNVTEHELITASIDEKSREEKSQAKKWRTLSFSWSLFWIISYIVALIPCFICNLAINKGLTWFWIVVSALILAFTFTNLPKHIKKHKLILIPLSMFLALTLLLGVCCIYSNGNWFWITILSIILGLIIIFTPIYISKLKVFEKIRKYNDYISIAVAFVFLNILLGACNIYSVAFNYTQNANWYFSIALPIIIPIYLYLNLLISIKFLKINKFYKTSLILTLITLFIYIPPLFIKVNNPSAQKELGSLNIFKANFANWTPEVFLENNIHCIIACTLLGLSLIFLLVGIIRHLKRKS